MNTIPNERKDTFVAPFSKDHANLIPDADLLRQISTSGEVKAENVIQRTIFQI